MIYKLGNKFIDLSKLECIGKIGVYKNKNQNGFDFDIQLNGNRYSSNTYDDKETATIERDNLIKNWKKI